ncbi:MAG: ribonuclease H-like domain-containing protein [candidate division WWE3 bacterium]|nr:ribonuclease H-like domain-containing protein [candidate division WWE3 bacterium]
MPSDYQYLVKSHKELITKTGKKCLKLSLLSRTEKVEGVIWEENFGNCDFSDGAIIEVTGNKSTYFGSPTINIEQTKIINGDIATFQPQIATMVFDIETFGASFDSLTAHQQEYLINNLTKGEEDLEKAKQKTGLFYLFSQVVAIGMFNPDTNSGQVLAIADTELKPEKTNYKYQSCANEKELLEKFWELSINYKRFVGFNSKEFDLPFLKMRSAINRVKVSNDLKSERGNFIDLQDELKQGRAYKLEFICEAFGIENPKEAGVSGLAVQGLFKNKQYQTIADYVARDAYSTAELYKIWLKYMSFD